MSDQDKAPGTNGWLANLLLNSLHIATGQFYQQILTASPWQRFLDKPPPDDPTKIVGTADEFALVCAAAFNIAGKHLFIMFSHSAGRAGGKLFAEAVAPQIKPALAGLRGLERLYKVADLHKLIMDTQGMNLMIEHTDYGVSVTSLGCLECRYIRADEAVCYFSGDGLKLAYSQLSDLPVSCKEVECVAQGNQNCRYELRLSRLTSTGHPATIRSYATAEKA